METWYRVSRYIFNSPRIEPVEVLKATEKQLVLKAAVGVFRRNNERRVAKQGTGEWYFSTRQEAKDFWVRYMEREYEAAKTRFQQVEAELKEAREL